MIIERTLGRRLGAAYLFVVAASLTAGLLADAHLTGPIEQVLTGLANDPRPALWSAVVEVGATAVGIVVLAALLRAVVAHHSAVGARWAFGLWVLEAAFMATGALGTLILVRLVEAGAATPAFGTMLVSLHDTAHAVHMVFFAVGGLVWYALMFGASSVPRWLAGFGMAAVGLALVATVGGLVGLDLNQIAFGLPTGVFEVTIGLWVIIKGVRMPDRVAITA